MDHERETGEIQTNTTQNDARTNRGAKILYMCGRPELDDKLNRNTLRYVQRIAEHGSLLDANELR
jgi:hypothetical protein